VTSLLRCLESLFIGVLTQSLHESRIPLEMASKNVINTASTAVLESIDGLLLTRQDLVRLDAFPGIKVVRRRDMPSRPQVGVVSGGGSGHEPAHAGFVGQGMLTSAVCGDVFASPQVNAFLAGILSADNGAGSLFVCKNYTGDRLAATLALQQARALGKKAEIVFVADDIALGEGHSSVIGKRGVAGTVFVHKVAGYLAENGATLEEVFKGAKAVADSVVSIGFSLTTCRIPGQPQSDRLDGHGACELGLGIHGEPGATKLDSIPKADELVGTMLDKALASIPPSASLDVALLVNNLGGLSNLEMGIVTNSALKHLNGKGAIRVKRLISGPLMTSLDMKGFSLTLLPLAEGEHQKQLLKALDYPVGHPGSGLCDVSSVWPGVRVPLPGQDTISITPADVLPLPEGVAAAAAAAHSSSADDGASSSYEALTANIEAKAASEPSLATVCRSVLSACRAIEEPFSIDLLNRLDTITGDGDCGATFKIIAAAVRKALSVVLDGKAATSGGSSVKGAVAGLASECSKQIGLVAGGSSGVIYALLLQSFANHLREEEDSIDAIIHSAKEALFTVMMATNARPGDRTMIDAFVPACERADAAAASSTAPSIARAAAAAASEGAESTATMVPKAGRASYVSYDIARGHEDPGARAAAIWLKGLADGLSSTTTV
jgi:triose/dihydroxyacetone kinase / FAD-AMP lyase (cyclizing)